MTRMVEKAYLQSANTIPIGDDELLSRAVKNARARRGTGYCSRWVAVSELFCMGSTYSQALCRRFGLDPDEQVRR